MADPLWQNLDLFYFGFWNKRGQIIFSNIGNNWNLTPFVVEQPCLNSVVGVVIGSNQYIRRVRNIIAVG